MDADTLERVLTQVLKNQYAIMRHLTYDSDPEGRMQVHKDKTLRLLEELRVRNL
jgi:hypothetical protein